MANDVFANGREISCKKADGKTICEFPDVCFTPPENPATPPGVPIPYPNTAFAKDTTKGSKTVKITGQEVMLKNKSYFKTSTGDEAGCAAKKGVITSKIKGKAYFISWSMDVKFEGENVVRHLDMTTNNHASPMANGSVPQMHTDTQVLPESPPCPPHDCQWYEFSRKSVEETKKKNSENAAILRSKPSKAIQASGPEFENRAIDENMDRLEIQATSVIYKCSVECCNNEQEVDILGKDRIAEAKSRTNKGWKNAKKQHRNYKEIQQKVFVDGKPLAKADSSKLSDVSEFKELLSRRGFGTEIL